MDDRNWIRLLAALEGFAVRHGAWPSWVRLAHFVHADLKELFTAGSWQRLQARLQIVVDDETPIVAEDDAGRRYSYGDEGPAPTRSVPGAQDWLGVEPDAGSGEWPIGLPPENLRVTERVLTRSSASETPQPAESDCSCWTLPIDHTGFDSRRVGIDETAGRFAEVSVERCKRFGQEWLRYSYEYESEPESGRWYQAAIFAHEAENVSPSAALEILGWRRWHFFGGSYFRTRGARRAAPLDPQRV